MRRIEHVWLIFALAISSCARTAAPTQPTIAVGANLPFAIPAPIVRSDAPPRIVRVWISQDTVSAGDVLRGHVTTTTNVANLYLHLGPRSVTMRRTAYGQFDGSFRVPWLPYFLHRPYTVTVIAITSAGATANSDVTLAYR